MSNCENTTWKIRLATVADAKELLGIYAPYVSNTAVSFEHEVPTVEEFAHRIEETLKVYPYLVIEEGGEIRGYTYASRFKARAAYDWSVETTIYLRQDCKRKGYGRALYLALENYLKQQNVLNANACIAYAREDNDHLDNSSLYFHEKMGYKMVGTFHNCGYKFSQWYDMFWMEKFLGEHKKEAAPFIPFSQL